MTSDVTDAANPKTYNVLGSGLFRIATLSKVAFDGKGVVLMTMVAGDVTIVKWI